MVVSMSLYVLEKETVGDERRNPLLIGRRVRVCAFVVGVVFRSD